MVEVLRHGERPEDRVYTATCGKCKALLRFKRSEARYVSDQRDGDAVVVECPDCKTEVWRAADSYQHTDISDASIRRQTGGW